MQTDEATVPAGGLAGVAIGGPAGGPAVAGPAEHNGLCLDARKLVQLAAGLPAFEDAGAPQRRAAL